MNKKIRPGKAKNVRSVDFNNVLIGWILSDYPFKLPAGKEAAPVYSLKICGTLV